MHTDLHVHSNVSGDSSTSMEDMAIAAIKKGIDILCFTDHCDPMCGAEPGVKRESGFEQWAVGYDKIATVREKYGDQIEILHGMELGEIPQDPIRAREWAKAPGLDFVLGSIHAVPQTQDFYYLQYGDEAACRKLSSIYLDENIRLARENVADVVGHIGYTNRYMVRHGKYIDLMGFRDKLEVLFKLLAESGRGLEINCSGLRQKGLGESFPNLSLLKLYKECGGEIVTIGSDAHNAHHVGEGFDQAKEIAKEAGFGYITVFRQRKPEFIAI